MGRRVVAEEARYSELQCRGGLASELLFVYTFVAVMYDGHDRAQIHHGTDPEYLAP